MARPSRFFIGLLLGFTLATTFFFARFYRQLGVPTESSRWCHEINSKKLRLAQSIPGPKLLLVGGSSTLFGLSAEAIQRQTGYPAVNLGTHAALGVQFMLTLAKRAAKPGDTILLSLEYEVYDWRAGPRAKGWNDGLYFDYVFSREPDFFRSWPWWDKLRTALCISNTRLKEGLRNLSRPPTRYDHPLYNITNINAHGDQVGHPASRRPGSFIASPRAENLIRGLSATPAGFPALKAFCDWAKTNHVRVLYTFATISHLPEYDREPGRLALEKIRQFFLSIGVPVLGDPAEAIMPSENFFDTIYHPTDEAQLARTRRLIVHLSPLLKHPPITAQDGILSREKDVRTPNGL